MCARMCQIPKRPIRVGGKLVVEQGGQHVKRRWTGFARSESREKWTAWEDCKIPVVAFAEKSRNHGQLVWLENADMVLRGLTFRDAVVVVTREATAREKEYFGHHRVPLEA